MSTIGAICIYCGSREGGDPRHVQLAADLGTALAEKQVQIIYGGGAHGLMGALAKAALAAGGHVTGIMPQFLLDREVQHQGLTQLITVGSMHARKALMIEMADALLALPGGIGTLDEVVEALTWASLGLHNRPLWLLSDNGYWQPFLNLVNHMEADEFAYPGLSGRLTRIDSVAALVTLLEG